MPNIVQITDFKVGRFKIPTKTYSDNDLQSYIDRYHRHYLIRLLGIELYDLFIADLDPLGVPQDPNYLAFYNPFTIQENGCFCDSEGMKEMIKALIYFHYVRDKNTVLTTIGPKQKRGENSQTLDIVSHDITTRYNEGINTYDCIQKKLHDDPTTYPEYDGVVTEKILFI